MTLIKLGFCRNPSLGLATKARGVARLWAKEARESPHMFPKVQIVWGNEPSHSQVNSHCKSWSPKWIPKSSERDCRGQNPLVWIFFYIIRKLLKLRCLKWAPIIHLDIWNTSYDKKKGQESNCQFDSRPLKVRNRPDFLMCRWCATYCWKAFSEGYNFALDFILIGIVHAKLCTPKVAKVPVVGISVLPLKSPGTKSHLDVAPMERHIVYYKGKVMVSPSPGSGEFCEFKLPMVRPSTKSALTMN
jgi:hypothetical protein